ncbi:hypothetical protein CDAR_520891 [Caerostris darwini]|uniref:Uncharacterized protein n=1 Tax=Caerostris darwini TaxID=1538125 RepID=A0AAV4V3P1_9ARAC|nr:hypothetical protein CDAR_520891 [Caerostris darwini]
MTSTKFDHLLTLVGPVNSKRNANYIDSIHTKDRLALTLSFSFIWKRTYCRQMSWVSPNRHKLQRSKYPHYFECHKKAFIKLLFCCS